MCLLGSDIYENLAFYSRKNGKMKNVKSASNFPVQIFDEQCRYCLEIYKNLVKNLNSIIVINEMKFIRIRGTPSFSRQSREETRFQNCEIELVDLFAI